MIPRSEYNELDSYKNQTATINVDNLCIGVVIKDARMRFGHLDFLVTPILGTGEKWMEHHRVTPSVEKPKVTDWLAVPALNC